MKVIKPSKKFIQRAKVYLHFCPVLYIDGDINKPYRLIPKEDDLLKQYVFESFGPKKYQELFGDLTRQLSGDKDGNPYSIGKAWKEWHITNWLEDINSSPSMLTIEELYEEYEDNSDIKEMLDNAVTPNIKNT